MRVFKRSGRFFVYILKCSDGTFYTGYTPDLKKRFKVHSSGKGAKYTRARLPVKLIWHKEYKYFKTAFLEEKRIKKLTRKEKKILVKSKNKRKTIKKAKNKNERTGKNISKK